MLKELPPKNLDRVVELIAHAEKRSHDEINVDLEKEVKEEKRAHGYIF